METGAYEETATTPGRMPLNAGEPGYGSMSGPGLAGAMGDSESAPLLIPEEPPEPVHRWQPLSREELEEAAGGPGWRKVRCYLVLLFWLAWVAMLATAIAIIVLSPRPVPTELKWWQKTLFYRMEPDKQADGTQDISALSEQIPYIQSLGMGALILSGLFDQGPAPENVTSAVKLGTLPQIEHLITESNKAGLKVVLDFCGVNVMVSQDVADKLSNVSATAHHGPKFWLQQGVAGFAICDTDAAYSEKTLLEWRSVFPEFSIEGAERIVVVRQTKDSLIPLNNATLVDVIMRSILPPSNHLQSALEVASAIEQHLQIDEGDIWPSWTVGGKASPDLKKLLLVLIMTLPGSPAVQYDEDLDRRQNVSLSVSPSLEEDTPSNDQTDKEKKKRLAVALFTSLSHSRSREEALLFGSFTFLPFNSSTNTSSSSNSSPPPVLAFLRSWGCVHFLVLLNVGPESRALDPSWAPRLPKAGVFSASSGMDRLGTISLDALELQPHEAIVIKLFEAGSYS